MEEASPDGCEAEEADQVTALGALLVIGYDNQCLVAQIESRYLSHFHVYGNACDFTFLFFFFR
jgi:hypothetical protein